MGSSASPPGDLALLFGIHGCEAPGPAVEIAGHFAVAVGHLTMALRLFLFTRFMMPGSLTMMVRGGLMIEGGTAVMGSLAPLATNLLHMFAITTDSFTASAPCLGSFLFVPFMGGATLVRCPSASAGDLTLLFRIHCSEPTTLIACHDRFPPSVHKGDHEKAYTHDRCHVTLA